MAVLASNGAVAELADAGDLKSSGGDTPCGFDSHSPHMKALSAVGVFFYSKQFPNTHYTKSGEVTANLDNSSTTNKPDINMGVSFSYLLHIFVRRSEFHY